LKNKEYMCRRDYINQLRSELHHLIESEDDLTSSIVQEKSQELDSLILMYYGRGSMSQKSKDP
jgi:hypothetical protein